ncbi:ATP synthase subunit epsilon stunted isoform X1 [Leptinotarsa decemlineata]|uniref:ATP synthase subunit epsilon stunted isoform X1 n=1 Tax=Leptinotarsa decemlineata TaxID=7539 RepID=UPI000C25526B|nr:protein stunted-like isoform X1 [Leptinotarsa decemlineata]
MSAWRQAGLNYINYSNIAAKLLRQALKPELRADAMKRADTHLKVTKWENGKPIKESTY